MLRVSGNVVEILGTGDEVLSELTFLESKILKKIKDKFGDEAVFEAMETKANIIKEELNICLLYTSRCV